MFTYLSLFVFGVIMVSFNGFDLITSISATAACLGNVGPGLSLVGPMQNYSLFAAPVKVFLSFLMLAGRLELFTIVINFYPQVLEPRQAVVTQKFTSVQRLKRSLPESSPYRLRCRWCLFAFLQPGT